MLVQNKIQKGSFNPKQYERPGLGEEEICEIKEAFDVFDTDNSGVIKTKDLTEAMVSLGHDVKNHMIYQMISSLEMEGKTKMEFGEFLDLMTSKFGEKDNKDDIKKIFRLFEEENTGYISIANLKRVSKEIGENMDDTELVEMIERADSDGDGRVTFEDFYNIMTKRTFI